MGATASSLVCVSESTPVYFVFLPFAVLPRRFTVPWFVHAWCLLPATAAALTIRARQLCRLTSNLIGCPSEHRRGPGVTSYGRGLDSTALTPLPAQDRMYPFGIIEIAYVVLQGYCPCLDSRILCYTRLSEGPRRC